MSHINVIIYTGICSTGVCVEPDGTGFKPGQIRREHEKLSLKLDPTFV